MEVTIPPVITAATPAGTVIPFIAFATDSAGKTAWAGQSVAVESNPVLALTLLEDLDPVAPNKFLTYTLSFGNRSLATLAPSTRLSMPIPAGTTFVSATGNGSVNNGVVEWDLGGLAAGQSGRHQLQVLVDIAASEGQMIAGEGRITDSRVPSDTTRASSVNRVESVPLGLSIKVTPDPARASGALKAVYTLTNLSGSTLRNPCV